MPARIAAAAGRRPRRLTPAETVRCIIDSLADGVRAHRARRPPRSPARRRRDPHRRRRLAERAALPAHRRRRRAARCIAGPVEATALGNVLVQARAHGALAGVARRPSVRASPIEPLRPAEVRPVMKHLRDACGRSSASSRSRPTRSSAGWLAPRRSPTCGGSRSGACPAACSTTSTAPPRTSARSPPTRRAFADDRRSGRACCAASRRSTSASTMLGRPLAYPLVLAPTGFTRIADPQGELAVARAAARAGLPYTLSTLSTRSIEEVRAVSDGRLWFQVYAWRDRGLVKEMIDRAAAARLRGARAHRRHRGARPPRARRAPRVLAAAHDRAAHDRRRRAAPGVDVGVRAQRADPVRQRRRPRRRRRRVAGHAVRLHQHAVRPGAVVGRRRVAALGLGRPDRRQGHPDRRRRACSPPTPASTRSRCRTTAAASSTARPRRSRSSRRSPTRSAAASRSSATAACGAAATS